MDDTANIKIQVDKIMTHDYRMRNTIAKALLSEGYEVTVVPSIDKDGRIISEEITVYEIEKIALETKRRY